MTRAAPPVAGRQPDEALDLVRHADQRVHRLAVAGAGELQRDGEAEIGDERERMRRIDRERRQQREDLPQEMILAARSFPCLVTSGPSTSTMPCCGELDAQLAPARLLVAGERRDRLGDARELLGRREPVGASGGDAGAQLALEAGDADHEEFVEVVGRDREEPHPLEQRMGVVCGLLEHPAVEVQPGQLTVDEALRARRQAAARPRARLPAPPESRGVSSVITIACARSHGHGYARRGHDRRHS